MAGAAARVQIALRMKRQKLLEMATSSQFKLAKEERDRLLEALRGSETTSFLSDVAAGKSAGLLRKLADITNLQHHKSRDYLSLTLAPPLPTRLTLPGKAAEEVAIESLLVASAPSEQTVETARLSNVAATSA